MKNNHTRLIAGLVLGFVFGTLLHPYSDNPSLQFLSANIFTPIGQIFLRMIFMIVVPMIFSALVLAVFDLGQSRGLGRIASRTLFYTVLASAFSVIIGIGLVRFLKPGAGMQIDQAVLSTQMGSIQKYQKFTEETKPVAQTIIELVPKNPLESALRALDGEMLSLMIFALFLGLALSVTLPSDSKDKGFLLVLDQLYGGCMKIVEFAMRLGPYAVFALVFNTAFKLGIGVFGSLLFYVFTVVLGLLVQQFVVYSVLLKVFAKRSPIEFFKACKDVYLYAFSTASSNATLPKTIETAEERLNLPKDIARFVLTLGSTANQNGTALFEGITVLFLAQIYGIDLSFGSQVQVVIMSILAGIGTAGVPGGSLPLIMILLQSVGIPPEGIGLILGVDRFLDMCRTTLNVSGDLVITALVSAPDEK